MGIRGAVWTQYLLGLTLACAVYLLLFAAMAFNPNIGWEVLYLVYAATIIAQVTFYILTSRIKLSWSVLAFVLNLAVWILELVLLNQFLEGTQWHTLLYHTDSIFLLRYLAGGVFWTTNKILIEAMMIRTGVAVAR